MDKLYKFTTVCILAMLGLLLMPAVAMAEETETEKQPAFPGAEGYGRYVTGGRGGKVYHVTTLEDGTQEGTLRYAVKQSGIRTVVFDVSGTIHLTSALSIVNPNITIAGQTAPGDGICVADYPFSISANNVIIRYMRFRLGNKNVTLDGADGWDGLGATDKSNIIVDHCSVSWSIDECLSFVGCENTTVQWCIVSQSLKNSGHSKGSHGYGGNWGGAKASYHHNLMIHHDSRTPRLGPRYTTQLREQMDMRNNVIYNYGGNGCYGGEAMKVNIVNNYYKPGPATKSGSYQYRIAGLGIRTNSYIATYPAYEPTLHVWGKYYVDGNANHKYSSILSDNWTKGIYEQINASANDGLYNDDVKDSIKLTEPLDFIYTTTHSASDAWTKVLEYAGASLSRDSHDSLMINDAKGGVATYTGSGNSKGIINSQDDNKPSGAGDDWSAWPTLNSTEAPADTDGDGMPDEWETANGLNPNDASDGPTVTDDGYTNLEHYLNSIVATITEAQNEGGTAMGGIETGSSEEAATTYQISGATYEGSTATTQWDFAGGFKITNVKTKAYATGKYNTVKFSRNTEYTLVIPDGMSVASVEVIGYSNVDGETAYIGEFNGTTYDATQYVYPSRTDVSGETDMVSYTITFDTPVSGSIAFKPQGQQVCWAFNVTLADAAGVKEIKTMKVNANDVYTVSGQLIKKNATSADISGLKKGIYIIGNKKQVIK